LAHPEYFELIKGIRGNDKQSLDMLFRLLYVRLRNYANTIINSKADSEDIVQEVFLKLWSVRAELDEHKSIENYLFVATRNSCLNWLKHLKIKDDHARVMALVYENYPIEITPYESMVARNIEDDLRVALNELPTQCRRIFELNRFEGLKYHEIASKLNISIKTVETQMSRALTKVRFQLKKHNVAAHGLLVAALLSYFNKP
jgi:RNA polymerase sigma-70 factor (ECF subfamily)